MARFQGIQVVQYMTPEGIIINNLVYDAGAAATANTKLAQGITYMAAGSGSGDTDSRNKGEETKEENGKKEEGKAYTGGRTQTELDDLAYDPAKKAVTEGSKKEAAIGLELEQKGKFGKLERSLDPKAEFIDITTGKKIDVKSFESNPIGADGKPITSPRKGAFKVENAMKNIIKEFEKNGNDIVVIDKTNLKLEHIKELEEAIKQSRLENKIIWWPE